MIAEFRSLSAGNPCTHYFLVDSDEVGLLSAWLVLRPHDPFGSLLEQATVHVAGCCIGLFFVLRGF